MFTLLGLDPGPHCAVCFPSAGKEVERWSLNCLTKAVVISKDISGLPLKQKAGYDCPFRDQAWSFTPPWWLLCRWSSEPDP